MSEPSRYRDAFAFPEFRAIFLAHVISMTGTVLAQLALAVLMYARSGSALLSALTFAVAFLPQLITGTVLSAVVDRVPTRLLLIGCSLLSAAIELVMALPANPVPVLLVLCFALGLMQPLFSNARSATLRDVLTESAYVPGRSLIRLVSQGAQLAGFSVGGILLTVVTPRDLLLGDAASFGLAALLLRLGTRARPVARGKSGRPPLLQDSFAGIKAVFAIAPLRRTLLFTWGVAALAVVPTAVMVPYAADQAAGPVGLGLLLTAGAVGTVIGEALTVWLISAARQVRIIRLAMAFAFVPRLLFAVRPGIPLAVTTLFISGLGAAAYLGIDRLMLELTPAGLLPRVLGLQSSGLMFWQAIGLAAAGGAAELVAPQVVITMSAACGLLAVAAYAVASRHTADVAGSGRTRWNPSRVRPDDSPVRQP
ncbi:MAG TPA: MFS transporter [Trebonia sp.]